MKNNFEIRGNVVAIFLRRVAGPPLETQIDVADLPIVQAIEGWWRADWSKLAKTFYVRTADRQPGVRKWVNHKTLHCLILGNPGIPIDHWNHNGLDNRRENLRAGTYSANALNRRGPTIQSKSGVRNVYPQRGRWRVQITVRGKRHRLGMWDHFEDAKEVAENFMRVHHIPRWG